MVKLMQMRQRQAAFTLIELLVVIVVVGIIAVMVSPRWTASGLGLEYEARRVAGDIRYTQALSMLTGQRYRWVKTSSTTYQIVNESGSPIVLPGGGTQTTLTGGVTLYSLANLPNNLVLFNSLGVPYVDTGASTALGSTALITLTASGLTRSVQIIPQTGYGVIA